MQRLGLVLHISPSRNLIVKVEKPPKIGEMIVDENLKPIGKVFDILGPVSSPYVAIRPTICDPDKTTNSYVYLIPSKRRKEKNKYG